MTDIGVADFSTFQQGDFSADDNTIYLGRSSSKVSLRTLKKLTRNTTNLEIFFSQAELITDTPSMTSC